jgi:hypothetical protein
VTGHEGALLARTVLCYLPLLREPVWGDIVNDIDKVFQAAQATVGDHGTAIYFREMLQLALSLPLTQSDRDFVWRAIRSDLIEFQRDMEN